MPPQVNPTTNQSEDKSMYDQLTNPTISTAITAPRVREPKELCIHLSKPFNSNHSNLNCFIQDCSVYLKINQAIYNDNDKQITFMLSLLDSEEPVL